MLRYSLLRLLVFLGCVSLLWLVGLRDRDQLLLLVVGAALLSAVISYFALRRFREDYSAQLAHKIEARSAAKRAAAAQPLGRRGGRGRRGVRRRGHLPLSRPVGSGSYPEPVDLEFSGEVWFWRGPAPHHFVSVPDELCGGIEDASSLVTYGWGMIPVTVRLGVDLDDLAVAQGRRLHRAAAPTCAGASRSTSATR